MERTEAQACIDDEIAKHLSLVSDLRTQRNYFLPISRLLPETLVAIFIYRARNNYEHRNHSVSRVPSWANVSYVCHHWRDVALACPVLWSYHFTVSLRWTEELLRKSQQAPSRIRIFPDVQKDKLWWSSLMEILMNPVDHIEELRLDLPHQDLLTKLSLRASCLQNLDIAAKGNPSKWPSALFFGHTPALRTLKLSNCTVLWYSLTLSGLTTLRLHRLSSCSKQNMDAFRVTLSRMQNLTTLFLEDALAPTHNSRFANDSSKIDLPRPACLVVVAPLSTTVTFLSCITFPLKTEVRLEFKRKKGFSLNDYALISLHLSQRFGVHDVQASPDFPTLHSLIIESTPKGPKFIFSTK